jgi:hypothetical protein
MNNPIFSKRYEYKYLEREEAYNAELIKKLEQEGWATAQPVISSFGLLMLQRELKEDGQAGQEGDKEG